MAIHWGGVSGGGGGGGTVTSVDVSGGTTGLTTSGGPITGSGTITFGGTLAATAGGTGQASYTVGDLVYASTTTALSKLADVATGNALISGGVGVAPSYGKIGLTTHVSGTLPIANGGTGATTKANAFNALTPTTALGDLIYANGSSSATRLAIGSNGQYLQSNGSAPYWGALSVSAGSISGTIQINQGGTGTTTYPTSGQLLIGTGSSSYAVATLTAGSGISIANGSGSITISATAPSGPTISVLTLNTFSGSFTNSTGTPYSKPLIGSATTPTNYAAAYFNTPSGGVNHAGISASNIQIIDSTSASTSYNSGTDFAGSPIIYIYDKTVSFYGMNIYNSSMMALFTDTDNSITSPSVKPLNAAMTGGSNPSITVYPVSGPPYSMTSFGGIVVEKSGSTYYLYFSTGTLSASGGLSISMIDITVNSMLSSYNSGLDFNVSFAENTANGMFQMAMTISNPTLQTLFDNSYRA